MQIVERPLGPLKTIIITELERSCVERSERVLAAEAITDSSTAERKVRQQVEQRLKERKQRRAELVGKIDEMASDDDSQQQAVKSNDLLSFGQRKLTVTVCPRCKSVDRSGVTECHDATSRHVMECHDEVETSRCALFSRTRCRQTTLRRCQQWCSSGTTEIPSGRRR